MKYHHPLVNSKKRPYRFFQLKDKDFEDICRAENKLEAKEIFKQHYPERSGLIDEVFMKDFRKYTNK